MPIAPAEWKHNPEIIDFLDLDLFVEGVPHEQFAILRKEYPVYWNPEHEPEPGFWNLTNHEDICRVSSDTTTFSSAQGINIFYDSAVDPVVVQTIIGNMINLDPPLHTAYRKIPTPFFAPKSIEKMEPRIRQLTTEILDDVARRGECEFMSEVAARLPIAVLCDIMGVPHEDHGKIFEWSNKAVGFDDPELNPDMDAGVANLMEIFQYGRELFEKRREHPTDDLMSVMAHAKQDDMPIPQILLEGFFLLMVIAGNETTRNTISGGMQALIEHPDERGKLLDNPELIPTAVEEILRWVSPVMHMRRTATKAAEIRGVSIAEGDKVVMWYPAANRDEEVFENAASFDVTRDPNPHLAFGIGRHRCLGARLAQTQLRNMFGELLRRFPDMELAGPVRRMRSNFISGIKDMPVRFTPERG